MVRRRLKRSEIEIDREIVGFTLYEVDARTENQRLSNARDKTLDGSLNVYIPGHGQTANAATNLITTIVAHSQSKILWSVDIDPPKGGDHIRAKALIRIIKTRASSELFDSRFCAPEQPYYLKITLFGWSHGAAEAMLAAEMDSELIQEVIALTPGGLIERPSSELFWSFTLGGLRIFWDALRRFDGTIGRVLAVGFDIVSGVIRDCWRSKSFHLIVDDICWASKKVVGKSYGYNGTVILLFAGGDTTMRWRDVFPTCQHPDMIECVLELFRQDHFPQVRRLSVGVLEGNHVAPEVNASLYINTAFDLLESK